MQNNVNKIYVLKTSAGVKYIDANNIKSRLCEINYDSGVDLNIPSYKELNKLKESLFVYCREILNVSVTLENPTGLDIAQAMVYCKEHNLKDTDIIFVCSDRIKTKRFKWKNFDVDHVLLQRMLDVIVMSILLCISVYVFNLWGNKDIVLVLNIFSIMLKYYILRAGIRLYQLCMEDSGNGT